MIAIMFSCFVWFTFCSLTYNIVKLLIKNFSLIFDIKYMLFFISLNFTMIISWMSLMGGSVIWFNSVIGYMFGVIPSLFFVAGINLLNIIIW